MKNSLDELKAVVVSADTKLAAVREQIRSAGSVVIVSPPAPVADADRKLVDRLAEVMGKEKRLVVREKGIGGADLIRVVTPEYSFQVLLDSPEIVRVESFEGSLVAAALFVISEARRAENGAKREAGSAKAAAERAHVALENQTKKIKDQFEIVHRQAVSLVAAQDALAVVLDRWAFRNSYTNRRAVRKIFKQLKSNKVD